MHAPNLGLNYIEILIKFKKQSPSLAEINAICTPISEFSEILQILRSINDTWQLILRQIRIFSIIKYSKVDCSLDLQCAFSSIKCCSTLKWQL